MRLLDLFCGAGGAAMGYYRAGFDDIVGVDIKPQPRYPFAFVRADALEYLAEHGHEFDAIHASPPCQRYSSLKSKTTREWPDLIDPTRHGLIASGRPWVIENVMPAPLRHGVVLCGSMFGLRTHRHRRFETSFLILQPTLHIGKSPRTTTKARRKDFADGCFISVTGDVGSYVGVPAMGIDWMTGNELSEAIPPAYTEYVGRHLLDDIGGVDGDTQERRAFRQKLGARLQTGQNRPDVNSPESGGLPQLCATCRHLRPFELAPELNTCPVVNIRIHSDSAAIFGCNQWEVRIAPARTVG